MSKTPLLFSSVSFKMQEFVYQQLKEIFPEAEQNLEIPGSLISLKFDIIAKSRNGRLVIFELKQDLDEKKTLFSTYLNVKSLKEALSKSTKTLPPILIILTTKPIDDLTQSTFAEGGVPVALIGKTTRETRNNLSIALSRFSISLPEFTSIEESKKEYIGNCFVSLSRDAENIRVYLDAIVPALRDARLNPVSSAEIRSGAVLADNMLDLLNQSKVFVADITKSPPNTMFEIGLAHGTGKNIVLISREDADIPFDLRTFNIISYNNTLNGLAELRQRLSEHLSIYRELAESMDKLRSFLVSNYDQYELRSLCKMDFPDVYSRLPQKASESETASNILDLCLKYDLLRDFLDIIRNQKGKEYASWLSAIEKAISK